MTTKKERKVKKKNMLLSDGIRHVGDGLLEVSPERLQGILAAEDIGDIFDVESSPFAR